MPKRNAYRIAILGAGAWGTSIGKVLAEKDYPVDIWCHEEEVAASINREHMNNRYLMGVELPQGLRATTDLAALVSRKDYLLVAIPTIYMVNLIQRMAHFPEIEAGKIPIAVLSKGFIETGKGIQLPVDAMTDCLPASYRGNLVYISGPSHAEEVARHKITGLISASPNGTNAIRFRELLSGEWLLVFSSLDINGVQISAAVKNVIAIAFGMLDTLGQFSPHFGDNTESLLLAGGLNEIQRLGLTLGATHAETFTSIAGVGDLDVTCRSGYGRNRRLGREIILDHLLERYGDIEAIIQDMDHIGYFAEGVVAAKYAHQLARQHDLNLPICEGVFRVLNRQADPLQEVEKILKQLSSGRPAEPR